MPETLYAGMITEKSIGSPGRLLSLAETGLRVEGATYAAD